ncbi:hypothetical protein AURDEDRAFT_172158 [Auricularia subglabra TFB-10046 SS5]|nr:hypothetical protein AURDEDRAFT_172158 [Auricularia subglabra TFB-10046 SS5]
MADPSALAHELEAIVAGLGRAQTVHYLHVSSACLFTYDFLLTFPDEAALIWHAPWGIGKILFLIERYLSWPELFIALYIELSAVPQKVCDNGFAYITWSILVCITAAEAILILRTWAIWGGKQCVLFALSALLLVITAVNAYIVVAYLRKTDRCLVTSSSREIATVWITVASFELLILTMTLIKGVEHFAHTSSTLLVSLYRDGILYFVFLFVISLVNMTFVLSAPAEYVVLLAQ